MSALPQTILYTNTITKGASVQVVIRMDGWMDGWMVESCIVIIKVLWMDKWSNPIFIMISSMDG